MPGPIYFGFSRSGGDLFDDVLSKGILHFTGGDSNHAFIVYYDENWRSWIAVGANGNGVTPMPLGSFVLHRVITHLYAAEGFNPWDGMRMCVGDLDRPYDYFGMFNMAFVKTAEKITHHPIANLLASKDRLYCSEWTSEVAKSSMVARYGEKIAGTMWPLFSLKDDIIDPSYLQQAMASHPKLFREASLINIGLKEGKLL